jgi:nicotinamide-nucleotide adenylyltransferase
MKRGIFVGRFQPFHKGHLEAVTKILMEVDELVIVVGSSQRSHEINDPFTSGERITMIKKALGSDDLLRCWIIPVPDVLVHKTWVAQIVGYAPEFHVVYSNEPLTRRLFIEEDFEVRSVPFHRREVYSATEIRKRMLTGKEWEGLVPENVARFIKKIKGVERLRDLTKSDKLE